MKPELLMIGGLSDADRATLEPHFTILLRDPAVILDGLSATERARIGYAALKGHAHLDADFMDALPSLKIISNYGVGYDTIDAVAAQARGIKVTNTPDVLNDDVADLAVLLLLTRLRASFDAEAWLRAGNWPKDGGFPLQRKMTGGRVGILGLGRIGRAIANRLAAFEMDIHYWSRSPKDTPGWTYHGSATALAEAVDFLIVITVGGQETQGLVSAEVLKALGPDGILVNVARGSVVDENALIEALAAGDIAGAGLDVFASEPKIDPRFFTLPNVTLLPHVGSATVETRAAMGQLMCANLIAAAQDRPLLTPVN